MAHSSEKKRKKSSNHKKEKRKEDSKKKSKKKEKKRHEASHSTNSSIEPISLDNYFEKAVEFRVWLYQYRGKYFEDLTTDEARELFEEKFISKWNRGKLERMYYEGIPQQILEETKRTKHRWGFLKSMNEKDLFELASLKDTVEISTNKKQSIKENPSKASLGKRNDRSQLNKEEEDEREEALKAKKKSRTQFRQHHNMVMEELVPKATGREAQIEKKRETSNRMHGSARDKEANQDGLDIDESSLMGGSDNIQDRIRKSREARNRRENERIHRVASLKEQESKRMEKFMKDMGLQYGQKIQIQPRK